MKPIDIINQLKSSTQLRRSPYSKPASGWGEDWGLDPSRAPALDTYAVMLCELPGRIYGNVDYRSHYFRLAAAGDRNVVIYRRCGTGDDSISFGAHSFMLFEQMGEEDRYLFVYDLFNSASWHSRQAVSTSVTEWEAAARDDRIRKRRSEGKVVIEIIDPETRDRLQQERKAKRASKGSAPAQQEPAASVERHHVVITSDVVPFL